MLHDGDVVTVDGTTRRGAARATLRARADDGGHRSRVERRDRRAKPTATKLYVNLAVAERAEEVAALDVDGVGLLRAEFMVADALDGVHPRLLHASAASSRPFVDADERSRC